VSRGPALVFGGTGSVGSEVLRGLAEAGVETVFTWHRQQERALALAREYGHRAVQADLRHPDHARAVARGSGARVFVHCAAVNPAPSMAELDDEGWQAALAVNCHSALLACQVLAPVMGAADGGHVVLVGALDRSQALPLPVAFAATQGMLSAMAMALAKELGPKRILVNMVALGLLEEGLSRGLDAAVIADYTALSALRRRGRAEEAARAALWLALENTYMSGKVLAVNGGI